MPEAETLVRHWRDRLDPAAPAGVPAHVTVLYPFTDTGQIGAAGLAALGRLFAAFPAFGVTFPRCARFPGVLYLAPEPAEPFLALTAAAVAQWPGHLPYGGRFPDVIPHLTVASDQDPGALDTAEAGLAGSLPVRARITSAQLLADDEGRWTELASFHLGG